MPDNQAAIKIAKKRWKNKKSVKIGEVTTHTYGDNEVLNAEGQHKHQGVNSIFKHPGMTRKEPQAFFEGF